jgi:hypothetical protein
MMTRLPLLFVLIAGVASADPKADAKAHIQKAAGFHGEGKFVDALFELDAAYALDPDPGLLYAIAQVQVKLDRCAEAIFNYEKFIASSPGDKPAKAAREAIAACRTTLRAKANPEPPKPEPKAEPIAEPKPEPPKPEPAKPEPPRVADTTPPPVAPAPEKPSGGRAWYADPLGGVLVGVGIAGGVTGVLLYRKASSDIDAAPGATNYGNSEDLVERAESRRKLATIAGVAGGALVIGGIIRYVTAGGREQRGVAIVPTSGGAAVTLGGRW